MYLRSIVIHMAAALFLVNIGTLAQDSEENRLEFELQIQSKFLNEERTLTIALPDGYYASEDNYPVFYLLDGRTHFQHSGGAVNFLSQRGIIPQVILVSVHNIDRNRDFSPVHDERIPTSGGADKFLDFMEKEVPSALKEKFRISDYSLLMGHSFGGTLAVHALNTRPGLFDAFIAVSPYLHFKENYVIKEAGNLIKPFKKGGKSVYVTVGDEPEYFEPINGFLQIIESRTKGTVDYKLEKMPSETHGTVPYISIFNGLRFVFSDWAVSPETFQLGMEAIDAHVAKTSKKYGLQVKTSELMINQLGYAHLQKNEMKKAIGIFSENAKRHPGSANVYDSLGEAYEIDGQLKMAEKNYQKACDVGGMWGDPNYPVYVKNLQRVRKELEK
ncbi:MAG: prolyl oligopeptidase family serine peptidase [Bacteroidetes bacterium]|nr:prolyl oligopeptidase family serine peptidase [Bacteroidota bacterium]